jgi:hypothetical protein
MEFLIGLGIVSLLVPFFLLVVWLLKLLPSEFSFGIVTIMLFGDGAISAIWYYGGTPFIENIPVFKLGIAVAFAVVTVFKVTYLVVNPTTRELLNFK